MSARRQGAKGIGGDVSKGITKKDWDIIWGTCHIVPCNIDFRKAPINQAMVCKNCGGIGVTDYNFDDNSWLLVCRECRLPLK